MTDSGDSAAARIDELEARVAHQDQAVLELGNEIYRQQKQIAQLETMLRHLADQLQSGDSPDATDAASDNVPPHY